MFKAFLLSICLFGIVLYAEDSIDQIIKPFMKKADVVGMSVAIVHKGEVVFARGYGIADKLFKDPVTPQHQFRIASLTKPMTAAAIMRLVQERKISLHDKVFGDRTRKGLLQIDTRRYGSIADNPTLFDIEVIHLLEHTAGNWYNTRRSVLTNTRLKGMKFVHFVLKKPAKASMLFRPGEHYAYSNFGYYVLGLIVEQVSGMAYEDYMRDVLLRDFPMIDFYPKGRLEENKEVEYYSARRRQPYSNPVAARIFSAGGAVSSVIDLVRFGSEFNEGLFDKNNRLGLTRASVIQIKTPQTAGAQKARYAKGWVIPVRNHRIWWHSGKIPATSSMLLCDDRRSKTIPDMCIGLIVNSEIHKKYGKEFKSLARKVGKAYRLYGVK